ncbi:anaerobic sulfatase-maturation protein [Porphyromonas macacae]|uniref:anaerobic sulfatase-maturation protein n=1 Tax=Porphyromonas macacae TaxID=28115 RepID=UPI0035A13003
MIKNGSNPVITAAPWGKPFTMMAKPGGAVCNMQCDYCYYLDKINWYKEKQKTQLSYIMSDELLEFFIRNYIASQPSNPVSFIWHGGESLLMPKSFYQRVVELQNKYAGEKTVENALQTNGLLINEDWCRFFKENHFLVGISLDGNERQHNRFRKSAGGQHTFQRVMRAIELMQRFDVSFNVLSTINSFNADDPVGYYSFLKGIGVQYIQFTPIVERLDVKNPDKHAFVSPPDPRKYDSYFYRNKDIYLSSHSVRPDQWGYFLINVFDQWVCCDVGSVFVQLFDAVLANWVGVEPGLCSMARYCGRGGVVEWNGDIYSCDHYVFPDFYLGNLKEHNLFDLMHTDEQLSFGKAKYDSLPDCCMQCQYFFACHGECPKNRISYTSTGEPGLNYLCAGYYRFFEHVAPCMDYMKEKLLKGQSPADIMEWMKSDKKEDEKYQ